MKRFSLRLTEAEYFKIKSYCQEINVSMNDTIRQLIREWSPNIQIVDKAAITSLQEVSKQEN